MYSMVNVVKKSKKSLDYCNNAEELSEYFLFSVLFSVCGWLG
jgi:hypothetical protein